MISEKLEVHARKWVLMFIYIVMFKSFSFDYLIVSVQYLNVYVYLLRSQWTDNIDSTSLYVFSWIYYCFEKLNVSSVFLVFSFLPFFNADVSWSWASGSSVCRASTSAPFPRSSSITAIPQSTTVTGTRSVPPF